MAYKPNKLSIVLVTRGRHDLLGWTIEKTLKNIVHPNTTLLVAVDDDDELTQKEMQRWEPTEHLKASIGPRVSYGSKYNRVLTEAPGDLYLGMVDYGPHVTPGFDEILLEDASIFPDGIGVIYNRLSNLSFSQINGVTARLVELMGYYYPPYFPFWYVDHWLDDIARMIGRITWSRVVMDDSRRPGTQGRRDIEFWCSFFIKTAVERENIAKRIMLAPDFQWGEWERTLRVKAMQLVRNRSTILNAIVYQNNREANAPDTEYHRRLRELGKQHLEEMSP